jgi:hypothetical protein
MAFRMTGFKKFRNETFDLMNNPGVPEAGRHDVSH